MKLLNVFALLMVICLFYSCKKENKTIIETQKYASLKEFFDKNAPIMQIYTINGSTGGSFTSPQGTKVNIPSNAFVNSSNTIITGAVKIEFMDLYKKSDMLLADMSTTMFGGSPLKSGGEFFIKASINNEALNLANGKKIEVEQPAGLTGGIDQANPMEAFVLADDSTKIRKWMRAKDSVQAVINTTTNYIYSLYQFSVPASEGTWCNSDNSSYFSNYTQTTLILEPEKDWSVNDMQVFLVFKNISSMVHVYSDITNFPYYYAPQGLECTAVAVGLRDEKIYACFTTFTISANLKVNLQMKATTNDEFIAAVKALN